MFEKICTFLVILIVCTHTGTFLLLFILEGNQFLSTGRICCDIGLARIDRQHISIHIVITHRSFFFVLSPFNLHTLSIGDVISLTFSLMQVQMLVSVAVNVRLLYQLDNHIFKGKLLIVLVIQMLFLVLKL